MSERRTPRPVPCFNCRSSTSTSQGAVVRSSTAACSVSASPMISIRPGSTSDSNSRSRISGESSISKTRRGVKVFTYVVPRCIAPFQRLPPKGRYQRETPNAVRASPTFAPGACLLLDKSVLDRVISQIGVRFHRHFLEDARAISADGLHRQVELIGDLRDRCARGQLAKNLELALRQFCVQRTIGIA